MLIGLYNHTLDDKLRLIIPSKLRDEIGDNLFVVFDFDRCLSIYPEKSYYELSNKIASLSHFNKDGRMIQRTFYSNSMQTTVDKQGRVQLPKILLDKTKICKDVYLIGVNDHIELWDQKEYDAIQNDEESRYSDLASIFGGENHE